MVSAPKGDERAQLDESAKNVFVKLIRYYTECVETESLSDIRFWGSDENDGFILCPSEKEWLSSGKEVYQLEDAGKCHRFGRKTRWRRRPNYYYSYPIFVQSFVRKDTGQRSSFVMPLLVFPVSVQRDAETFTIVRENEFRPQVNASVLNMRGVVARQEEKRAFVEKVLEQWDEDRGYYENFRQVAAELREVFGLDNYIDPDLSKVVYRCIDLQDVQTGFYAAGMVFVTQGSKYTFGLEEELKELESMISGAEVPEMPVVEALIRRDEWNEPVSRDGDNTDLVEITPLNDEQRQSIKNAFGKSLTVITGPPGTGKSQVVINIIATAVARGESVLFGSKNHQAVDVVLQRINEIQEEPIILKFGKNARESVFAEQLLAAVDKAIACDTRSLEEVRESLARELQNITSEENETWRRMRDCYGMRNKISSLDAVIRSIEVRLPEKLIELLMRNGRERVVKANVNKVARWVEKIESGGSGIWDRIWGVVGTNLEKRLRKRVEKILNTSGFGDEVRKYFLKEIEEHDIVKVAKRLCDSVEIATLYNECFKLQDNENGSATTVVQLENKLSVLQEHKCKLSPRYVDAIMRAKLKSLGTRVRSDIADYAAAVKRIEEDRTGGALVEELRKQKKKLFSSVVKAFPAICVTNLSVRHVAPLSVGAVDLVVIDEASQCDIASALPMLVRGKRAVIIGDEKQLIHVSNISKIDDQQLQAKHGLT